ncbi:MAG: hypothetical protein GY880_01775, partial [Planctomycetaceae bacterium]|nr:hypothetical protein [Planctomycetaceae bacterium]
MVVTFLAHVNPLAAQVQISPNPNPAGNTITLFNIAFWDYENRLLFENFGIIDNRDVLTNFATLNNRGFLSNGGLLLNQGT